ncbi:hypothetical protein GobsT_25780 [Gemmata obscuriglobus]|nr:HD domain-containing protein [Gemmata obscuriglobus]QEG27814.1 hypothetical protein GobsT_25780 [Gemmata obscuriglobus]VTS05154.1 Uncharacterized protein OS=Sorangium cellulosum (strain So ce56) GN=sce3000 PE=4 SV=1: HD [Gemmata obscuriglobus UQM 2246]
METLIVEVLRTREIQRLRHIRQLGLVHLVFPGGEHSRLVHSIGAAYLAVLFGRHIQEVGRDSITPFLLPDEVAIRDFALAALFHDLGHGPLSHAWEREIIGEDYDEGNWRQGLGLPAAAGAVGGRRLKWHVLVGQALLAWPEGELHQMLESYERGMAERIGAFLLGEYHLPYLPRLLDSDIDVDRSDFLRRDSQQCGVTFGGYDLSRLISTCALGTTNEKTLVVGFDRAKSRRVVEHFLVARRAMYEAVYYHRTVRAAEGMVALFLRRLKTVVRDGQFAAFSRDRIVGPLMDMVAGKVVTLQALLSADDFALHVLVEIVAQADGADPIVVDLAKRIRTRTLFKSVPRSSEQISSFLKSPEAYPKINKALIDSGFKEPESYLVRDHPKFSLLSKAPSEWGYFVDDSGGAAPIRDDDSFRTLSQPLPETDRLFVPEEALDAVARVIR